MGEPEAKPKKKVTRRLPKVGDFPNKLAWYDAVIAKFTHEREEYKKFGDGKERREVKKLEKFVEGLDVLAKDPKYADLLAKAKAKLGVPAPGGKK